MNSTINLWFYYKREMVWPKDQIRIKDDCYPVGDVFGVDIYEATHVNTEKKIFVTASELIR